MLSPAVAGSQPVLHELQRLAGKRPHTDELISLQHYRHAVREQLDRCALSGFG